MRNQTVDVLRGISLFGILLVNMPAFHSLAFYASPSDLAESPIDRLITAGTDIFAQASFYPLFAMLFGYGIAKQTARFHSKGEMSLFILRRMFVLFVFGIFHAFFLWAGDILVVYSILGVVFLLFVDLSRKALFRFALFLYLIPVALLISFGLSIPEDVDVEIREPLLEEGKEAGFIYKEGSFWDVTLQRMKDWTENNVDGVLFQFFLIFPLLLFGAYLAKIDAYEGGEENRRRFRLILQIALPLALFFKTMPYWAGFRTGTELIQDLLGGPALSFVYMSMIYLFTYGQERRYLVPIARVGKMSLSNYLFQSVICSTLFYGYGMGLFGDISFFTGSLIALGIYLFQILMSHIWLTRFSYGPFEFVWRKIAYRKKNFPIGDK